MTRRSTAVVNPSMEVLGEHGQAVEEAASALEAAVEADAVLHVHPSHVLLAVGAEEGGAGLVAGVLVFGEQGLPVLRRRLLVVVPDAVLHAVLALHQVQLQRQALDARYLRQRLVRHGGEDVGHQEEARVRRHHALLARGAEGDEQLRIHRVVAQLQQARGEPSPPVLRLAGLLEGQGQFRVSRLLHSVLLSGLPRKLSSRSDVWTLNPRTSVFAVASLARRVADGARARCPAVDGCGLARPCFAAPCPWLRVPSPPPTATSSSPCTPARGRASWRRGVGHPRRRRCSCACSGWRGGATGPRDIQRRRTGWCWWTVSRRAGCWWRAARRSGGWWTSPCCPRTGAGGWGHSCCRSCWRPRARHACACACTSSTTVPRESCTRDWGSRESPARGRSPRTWPWSGRPRHERAEGDRARLGGSAPCPWSTNGPRADCAHRDAGGERRRSARRP